ncbi:MAG: hypothetical protein AB7P40_15475 [Chloroflexota bacterium]
MYPWLDTGRWHRTSLVLSPVYNEMDGVNGMALLAQDGRPGQFSTGMPRITNTMPPLPRAGSGGMGWKRRMLAAAGR